MILLLPCVNALYLYNSTTQKFIGHDNKGSSLAIPVSLDNAIDFNVVRGMSTVPYVTFTDSSKKAIDWPHSGIQKLYFYPEHNKWNQSFLIILTASNKYMLGMADKNGIPTKTVNNCIHWHEYGYLHLYNCYNITEHYFELYVEVGEATGGVRFEEGENAGNVNSDFVSYAKSTSRCDRSLGEYMLLDEGAISAALDHDGRQFTGHAPAYTTHVAKYLKPIRLDLEAIQNGHLVYHKPRRRSIEYAAFVVGSEGMEDAEPEERLYIASSPPKSHSNN